MSTLGLSNIPVKGTGTCRDRDLWVMPTMHAVSNPRIRAPDTETTATLTPSQDGNKKKTYRFNIPISIRYRRLQLTREPEIEKGRETQVLYESVLFSFLTFIRLVGSPKNCEEESKEKNMVKRNRSFVKTIKIFQFPKRSDLQNISAIKTGDWIFSFESLKQHIFNPD